MLREARQAIVAGGTESMSLVPMGGHKIAPNPEARRRLPGRLPDDRASSPRTTRAKLGSRARSRTPSRCAAISARWRRSTRAVQGRDRAAQGQRRTANIATPTKGRAATPRSRRSRSSGRRSTSKGASPPATRRRRATARRRGRDVRTRARERAWQPLGRFVAFATAGVEPERFGIGPCRRSARP